MRSAVLTVLLATACVTLPPRLTREQFDSFSPGATTAAAAESALGRPMTRSVDVDGNATLVWVGGDSRASQAITLRFGPDGTMLSSGSTFTEAVR